MGATRSLGAAVISVEATGGMDRHARRMYTVGGTALNLEKLIPKIYIMLRSSEGQTIFPDCQSTIMLVTTLSKNDADVLHGWIQG
jgi:hypothetical protein